MKIFHSCRLTSTTPATSVRLFALLLVSLLLAPTTAVQATLAVEDASDYDQRHHPWVGGLAHDDLGRPDRNRDPTPSARRSAAACGEYTCGGDLHFCTVDNFATDWCEYSWYQNAFRSSYNSVCATTNPTVIVLAHQDECTMQIGSVKFDLHKDGVRIRRSVEKTWPYTVFGDTITPYSVHSQVLGTGSYELRVDVKDWNGCIMQTKNFTFDVIDC